MSRLRANILLLSCFVATYLAASELRLLADDNKDETERVLLLLPAGPLVMDLAITINGEPFRRKRDRMIASLDSVFERGFERVLSLFDEQCLEVVFDLTLVVCRDAPAFEHLAVQAHRQLILPYFALEGQH